MIYYEMNGNNEIVRDDFTYFEGALSMPKKEYKIVNGYNGALYLESYMQTEEYREKAVAWQAVHEQNELRRRREEECFSVINRGYLWYAQLNEEQMQELSAWYQTWLDVTETQVISQKPEWMKMEKVNQSHYERS